MGISRWLVALWYCVRRKLIRMGNTFSVCARIIWGREHLLGELPTLSIPSPVPEQSWSICKYLSAISCHCYLPYYLVYQPSISCAAMQLSYSTIYLHIFLVQDGKGKKIQNTVELFQKVFSVLVDIYLLDRWIDGVREGAMFLSNDPATLRGLWLSTDDFIYQLVRVGIKSTLHIRQTSTYYHSTGISACKVNLKSVSSGSEKAALD